MTFLRAMRDAESTNRDKQLAELCGGDLKKNLKESVAKFGTSRNGQSVIVIVVVLGGMTDVRRSVHLLLPLPSPLSPFPCRKISRRIQTGGEKSVRPTGRLFMYGTVMYLRTSSGPPSSCSRLHRFVSTSERAHERVLVRYSYVAAER